VQDEVGYFKKRLATRVYQPAAVSGRDWAGLGRLLGGSDDREGWLKASGNALWLTPRERRSTGWRRVLSKLRPADPCADLIRSAVNPSDPSMRECVDATVCGLLEHGSRLGTKLRWLLIERALEGAGDDEAKASLDSLRGDLLSELNTRGLPACEVPAWVSEIADGNEEVLARWIEREERSLKQGLEECGEAGTGSLTTHVSQAFRQLIDRERGEGVYGIPTGFADLDELLSGFRPGELIVLAARPSMGKSSLALNILTYLGIYQGAPAAYFSTSFSSAAVAERMICSVGKVDGHRVRGGFLNKAEKRDYLNAAEMLEPAQLFLSDSTETLEDFYERCRSLHAEHELSLIVVDQPNGFVQRVPGQPTQIVKPQEIALDLRAFARELGVPILMTASLTRRADRKSGPRLGDLVCRPLEVLADKILLLYRPEYYRPDLERLRGVALITVAVNKDGPTGQVELGFVRNQTRFVSVLR
jgi:replicative DNA helicase